MRCTSKIKIDQRTIKQLSQAAVVSLEQTTEALHIEIVQAQVVPRDTGLLQNESFSPDYSQSKNGKTSLIHSTPYARRLYFHPEYHFHREPWTDAKGNIHEGNPNAKGKWFEDWLPGGKNSDFAQKTFKELYRRNTGV